MTLQRYDTRHPKKQRNASRVAFPSSSRRVVVLLPEARRVFVEFLSHFRRVFGITRSYIRVHADGTTGCFGRTNRFSVSYKPDYSIHATRHTATHAIEIKVTCTRRSCALAMRRQVHSRTRLEVFSTGNRHITPNHGLNISSIKKNMVTLPRNR